MTYDSLSSRPSILLVEDEIHLQFQIQFNLEAEGYLVTATGDGAEACKIFKEQGHFDVIVLDVMLPNRSGFSIAREIRELNPKVGILMLTALSDDDSKIKGLESGVDDYLTKPFQLKEFLLRVKRMAERANLIKEQKAAADDLFIDSVNLVLQSKHGVDNLTKLEVETLKLLFDHKGQTVSREDLLQKVWGIHARIETRTVDNFIWRLRKILQKHSLGEYEIESVRGVGYRLEKTK